ncbi:UNVERIFIED_CONTAM: hypothetical protein K2H54_070032 [Gekko kuhli]
MSTDEITIPVTRATTPTTTGLGATPNMEGAGDTSMVPKYFGGAMAKATTQISGLSWGRFSVDTQETRSLTTPMHHQGSWYESSSRMGAILEDPGPGPGQEIEIPKYFQDTGLGILERSYDHIMQTVETAIASIPRLVGEAIQRELWAQPVGPPAGPSGGFPTMPPVGLPAAPPSGPFQGHQPPELLDTMFDGTPKKLAFFVIANQIANQNANDHANQNANQNANDHAKAFLRTF